MPVSAADFDIGGCVGRSRPRGAQDSPLGEGDVLQATLRATGEVVAMRRVQVGPGSDSASELLSELTRAHALKPHPVWLKQHPDCCFVREYTDAFNCRRAQCCVVEELADRSLEAEIIDRAVQNKPFPGLLAWWAALLQGLQAFHAQAVMHRAIYARNIFVKGAEVKMGMPGLLRLPAVEGRYPGGACDAYSADILALGVVFLEMAVLHLAADLSPGGPEALLDELLALQGGVEGLRLWVLERCALLGIPSMQDSKVLEVLAAMLAPLPQSRPTADDLLEWPCFATHVDPMRILPVWQRPCVVLAHKPEWFGRTPPCRSVLALPRFHQIFSREGAAEALESRRYQWCGKEHPLWWLADSEPELVADLTDVSSPAASAKHPPPDLDFEAIAKDPPAVLSMAAAHVLAVRGGWDCADEFLEGARRQRNASRLLAADVLHRASLIAEMQVPEAGSVGQGGSYTAWLGLAGALLERGHAMAARRCWVHAKGRALAQDQEAGGVTAAVRDARLYGLCELFQAVETLEAHWKAAAAAVPGAKDVGLRATHVALYYRSALAVETRDSDALAALGEFYRLVGSPDAALSGPAPDVATARSYFEQALATSPDFTFAKRRLASLPEPAPDEVPTSIGPPDADA